MMDVTLRHGIEYEADEPVAIDDLIKSLEANARLLRNAGDLLSSMFPGLKVEPKKISVVYLSQESPLKEILAYSALIVYQKDLEEEVPQIIEMLTGIEMPDQYDTVVTVMVMFIAIYGVSKAYDLIFPGRAKPELEETQDSLLRRLATMTGVAAERILAAAEVLFTGRSRRALLVASQNAFAPTRGQRSASIRTDAGDTLVPAGAVREAQAAAGLPMEAVEEERPHSTAEFHRNVRIVLHAMDRDRQRVGWAGHVPALFDDRIPMHLEKTLSPEAVFGKDEITGDILLTSEEDENGDMQPKDFLLVQAYLKD